MDIEIAKAYYTEENEHTEENKWDMLTYKETSW